MDKALEGRATTIKEDGAGGFDFLKTAVQAKKAEVMARRKQAQGVTVSDEDVALVAEQLDMESKAAKEYLQYLPEGIIEIQFWVYDRSFFEGWIGYFSGSENHGREALEDARSRYTEAATERPKDSRIHLALGYIHAMLGQSELAIAAGQRAHGRTLPPAARGRFDHTDRGEAAGRAPCLRLAGPDVCRSVRALV